MLNVNKRNKELQHLTKEVSLSKNILSTWLSTIDLYILTKSITSYSKSLQKSLYTRQKSYFHWQGIATYPYSQLTKLLLTSHNVNYPRKNLIYLKQVYIFQSNQIKFQNLKSLLPLKRFIIRFFNNLKSKETKSQIKAHLSYLVNSYFYNSKPSPCILHQLCILQNLRRNEDIVIMKPSKGNWVVILDQKLYNNAIQENFRHF